MLPHEASISEAISEAEKAAYEPDEGVEEFAEKLKYTIVSSYLLGSTLSISMYDHRHEALAQPKTGYPLLKKYILLTFHLHVMKYLSGSSDLCLSCQWLSSF